MVNTILAKRVNHIVAKGDIPVWPKGSKSRGFSIGKGCWIQQGCTFFDRGGITIGNGVFIAPKVNLITINHGPNPDNRNATYGRPIVIEDKVWIGIGATVLPGVRIGYGSIVGANSVVTRDVPPMTVVGGNPAKFIKKIEPKKA